MQRTRPRAAGNERRYTIGAVCAAAGIKSTTLNTWRARGELVIEKESALGWTRYDDQDALRVCLLAGLLRKGFEFRLAVAVTDGLHEEGLLAPVLKGEPWFVAVFGVDQNIDDRRRPDGPAYELRCAPSLARLVRHVAKSSAREDWAWQFIDLAKMWRNAERVLKESR